MYQIKKTLVKNGQKLHVLMTNTHSELLEFDSKEQADELAGILNKNTDNGCHYEVIEFNSLNTIIPKPDNRFPLSTEVRDNY